jgi:hypothetical protein
MDIELPNDVLPLISRFRILLALVDQWREIVTQLRTKEPVGREIVTPQSPEGRIITRIVEGNMRHISLKELGLPRGYFCWLTNLRAIHWYGNRISMLEFGSCLQIYQGDNYTGRIVNVVVHRESLPEDYYIQYIEPVLSSRNGMITWLT